MQGLKDCDAAAQEALEEAGVIGRVHKHPIGAYTYDKRQDDGSAIPVRVMVYLLEVEKEINRWREKNERQRDWVTTDEAAARVDEGGLSEMIKRLNVAAIEAMD